MKHEKTNGAFKIWWNGHKTSLIFIKNHKNSIWDRDIFFENKYQEFVRLLLNTKESLYVKKEKEKEKKID